MGVLSASGAFAQLTISEGFEGPLLSPTGAWTSSTNFAGQTIATSPNARRGSQGLRVVDGHGAAGTNSQAFLGKVTSGTGDQYVRVWWRETARQAAATVSLAEIQVNSSVLTAVEVKWDSVNQQLYLACSDRLSAYLQGALVQGVVPDGGYHLLDLRAVGIGTAAGSCALAIDGRELERLNGVDWSGVHLQELLLGEVWGENTWKGTLDFDDYAARGTPLASQVALLDAGHLLATQCALLTLQFRDSFNGQAAALSSDGVAAFDVDGGALLFSDSACTTAVDGGALRLPVTTGATSVSFGLVASAPGTLAVAVGSDDLIGQRVTLLVDPFDAGATVDAGPGDAGPFDAGSGDGGFGDAGAPDGGDLDAGTPDAGEVVDAGIVDGGEADGGAIDGGAPDGGSSDGGSPDVGSPDGGALHVATDLRVGCSCASGDPGWLAWLLPAMGVLRRRRRC